MDGLRRLKGAVQHALRPFDLTIDRYSRTRDGTRLRLLDLTGAQAVVDIGGNRGQYAARLRSSGYRGRIVSVEPIADAFAALAAQARNDPLWECRRVAVGEATGRRTLHIAANSSSSSLLPIAHRHLEAQPRSQYVGSETVDLVTLDMLLSDVLDDGTVFCLKLDVQGYEYRILRASEHVLDRVVMLEIELSTVTLYEGGALLPDMVHYLGERGLRMHSAWPVFTDPLSGAALQVDGTFTRLAC